MVSASASVTCPLETLPCAAARADRALHITAANGRFVESWLAVRSVTRSLDPVACEAAVDIVVDVEDAPLIVIGDMQDLTRIVGNLVANAIKFSHRGGKVECQLSRDRGWARLVVRDNGRGIDASFLPQVFDCFRQEPRTGAERTDGAGLGLAVVRQLVQEHGGIVRGESAGHGRGATFIVLLPEESLTAVGAHVPASRAGSPWYG